VRESGNSGEMKMFADRIYRYCKIHTAV